MPAINKILRGRYRIIQQLGDSEAGTVFMAHDSVREANVALKEIPIDLDKAPTINQRELLKRAFADEAKTLAKVKHESLPQIRGFFSEVDRQYLVTELVDGDDASEILAKNKNPLKVSDVVNWADQLLDALDYLHTLAPPIVHGNIKPQNVKLTSRGRIKLLDFRISGGTEAIKDANEALTTGLRYSSLEQILRSIDVSTQENLMKISGEKLEEISRQTIDGRSDLYALGAALYQLLTAQAPVDALCRARDIWSGKADLLLAPNKVNPAVPVEVSNILVKAMEIERERRFASASEMRQALQTAVAKAKAREAEEAKNQEEAAVRESLQAEEKRLEKERMLVEKERLRLEAERKQQKELIERQLKEAEAQRLEAERRAADAEKRLLENETKNVDAAKQAPAFIQPQKDASLETVQSSVPSSNKDIEFGETLFTEPKANKNSSWIMPAAVVIFLLIGGAIAAVWVMQTPNAVEANQTKSDQIITATEKPAPEIKEAPVLQPSTFTEPETSRTSVAEVPPNVPEAPAAKAAPKNKVTPPAPRVEKPEPQTPVKTQPKPKKAVTVDDLIGGN